ncbi:MAG: hypothetical protein HY083_11610 [Gammaproteobacteria bacterium]|nr:hypothetical protein [Gammaproteobacteria bacterium]
MPRASPKPAYPTRPGTADGFGDGIDDCMDAGGRAASGRFGLLPLRGTCTSMYVGTAADDSRDGGGRAAPGAAAESNGRYRHPCLTRHLCFLHVAGSGCRAEGRAPKRYPCSLRSLVLP